LTNLIDLQLNDNELTGEIPESICELTNLNWSPEFIDWDYSYIYNNQLCPPYASCIEDYVGYQDTSSCTGSAYFDGYHSRIRVVDGYPVNGDANQSAYAITGDAITVEAWVFPTNMNNNNGYKSPIILRSNDNFGAEPYFTYMLYIDNTLENSNDPLYGFSISDGVEGGSIETVLSNTPVTYENWMHVSGSFNGTDLKLYLNGELDAITSSSLSEIGEGGIGLYVGGPFWNESLRYFEGLIDEVRLWDVTRTQGEITESYNVNLMGGENNLVGYWPMNEGLYNYDTYYTPDLSEHLNHLHIQYNAFISNYDHNSDPTYIEPSLQLDGNQYIVGEESSTLIQIGGIPLPTLTLISGPSGMFLDDNNTLWWTSGVSV